MNKKPLGVPSIFILLGLLFIATISLRTISTPEIWTHLAQGRANAPISFLNSDSPVNTTHLYDKMAYTLWNIGGAPLLIILNIAGLLATFILLLQVSRKWGNGLSQGFALLIAGHLIFQSVDVGPQTCMLLFIALFVYLIGALSSPLSLFCTLVPLQILWTNMHQSFLFGPAIAAVTALQAAQEGAKGSNLRKKTPSMDPAIAGLLTAALLVSTLVNPYLFKLHAQVFANLASPAPVYLHSLFTEFFQTPTQRPLIMFVMILGAGGLITLQRHLPTLLTTMAIFGAFLVWTSPKATLLFAVLSFPFVVLSLTSISEYISGTLTNIMGKHKQKLLPATQFVFFLLVVLSLLPVVTNCAYAQTGSASNFGLGIQEELYPDGAADILNHSAFPERTINLAADGGFLAFKYNRKIFIDYRPGRYDKDLLIQLDSMMLGDQNAYDSIYDTYRPEAFIINTLYPTSARGLVTLLSLKIWKLAYFDGTTAILLLDKLKFAPILKDKQIHADGLARLEKVRADYAANIGKRCRAGNPAALIGSGKVFLALNRPEESKSIFSLLLQDNDTIPSAWIGLGNSQLLLKEFDAAVGSLKTATRLSPGNFMAWSSYASACKLAGKEEEFEKASKKAMYLARKFQEKSDKYAEDEQLITEKSNIEAE